MNIGDTVFFTSTYDACDRPIDTDTKTPLTVIALGNPAWSWDYCVESTKTGNRFWVQSHEIEPRQVQDPIIPRFCCVLVTGDVACQACWNTIPVRLMADTVGILPQTVRPLPCCRCNTAI